LIDYTPQPWQNDAAREEVAGSVRTGQVAWTFILGDIDRYLELITRADDYTLMLPLGGEAMRGFDALAERLAFFWSVSCDRRG
jgi:hypothetical protein